MLLNEEEQSNTPKNKLSKNKKKKKRNNNYKYYKKTFKNYNNDDDERITLCEHQNILKEYEEEMNFLAKKRKKTDMHEEFHNNINENFKDNQSLIICVNSSESNQKNENKINFQKAQKMSSNNENLNIKISKLGYIYFHLLTKTRLGCNNPSKLVDYISNEIENNNNFELPKKANVNYYDIKKLMYSLENGDIENELINKLIKKYFYCSFRHSIISNLMKKINKYIIKENNKELKYSYNLTTDINSINTETFEKNSKTKKDKYPYCNLLDEKLKNNSYKSCLSLTNDLEYFKSIIYLNNKYALYDKTYMLDKNIIKSLEVNRDLLKSYKEENREKANLNDKSYLNNLNKNKELKKYINKKLFYFRESFKTGILKILDKNNFNEIINILISNKNEEKEKLEKINCLHNSKKVKKNDLTNFLILLNFIASIITINQNPNLLLKSDLALLTPILKYFNKYDIVANTKIKSKKTKKIKKKNLNNKNKKINNNLESLSDSHQNILKLNKIEEEGNKEEQNKMIKIILNNNEHSLYEENQNSKTSNYSEFLSLKLPSSTEDNSIIKKENKSKKYDARDNLKYSLIESNNKSNYLSKNRKPKIFDKKFRIYQKRILNELSLGNDIFKLNCVNLRTKEKSSKNDEPEEEIYKKGEINIEIEKEISNIINENNSNNMEKQLLRKEGNKIIIYNDEYSEENKNYLNNENYPNNY